MRTVLAFLERDYLLETSYKAAFVGQFVVIIGSVIIFHYMSLVVGMSDNPLLRPYGGDFFSFLIIGVAMTDFLSVSLATFSRSIREGQLMGTLEMMILSPISGATLLLSSSLWSYLMASIRFGIYLAVGATLFGLPIEKANIGGALITLIFSISTFASLGMLMTGAIMLIKRAEALNTVLNGVLVLLGGVAYPVTVLPDWLQTLSAYCPLTYALEGMRGALLKGHGLKQLAPQLGALFFFSIILFSLSLLGFHLALRRAKVTGTLAQY